MRTLYLLSFLIFGLSLVLAHNTPPNASTPTKPAPAPVPTPAPTPSTPAGQPGTCPKPSAESLRCLREWACQYIIRLDLRCLLNLNGNPLLGNLISIPGVTSGGSGGSAGGGGGGGGILGNLLGGK